MEADKNEQKQRSFFWLFQKSSKRNKENTKQGSETSKTSEPQNMSTVNGQRRKGKW